MSCKLLKKYTVFCLCIMMVVSLIPVNCLAVSTSYTPSSSYKSGKYYSNLLSVKLTGNQADDIVAVAMSQVGYHQGSSTSDMDGTSSETEKKYNEYGYMHGLSNADWCAFFVSWCARQARISTSIIPKKSFAIDMLKGSGTYYDVTSGYIPKKGDLVLYEPSSGVASRNATTGLPSKASHVNIVYKDCTDGKIHTIGGNEQKKVRKSDYALPTKRGNWQNIQGYIHPNYDNSTTVDTNDNTVTDIGSNISVAVSGAANITTNNATLSGSCTKPSASVNISTCGIYIGTSSSNMTKKITENVTSAQNNGTTFTITYNTEKDLGMTLSSSTTYYYRFFVNYGGTEYKSTTSSFTTKASYVITNQKALLIIPKGKKVNAYSTVTGSKVIGTYGSDEAQRLLLPERYADLSDGSRRFEMVATDGTSYWVPYDSSFMTVKFLPTSIEPQESHIYLKAESDEVYYPVFYQYPANSYDTIDFSYSTNYDVASAFETTNSVIGITAQGVGTADLYFKAFRTGLTTKITVTVVDAGPPVFDDISITDDGKESFQVQAVVSDTEMERLGVAIWSDNGDDIKESPEITWYDVTENKSYVSDEISYVNTSQGSYTVTYRFDREDVGPIGGTYIAGVFAEDSVGGLSMSSVEFEVSSNYDESENPFVDVSSLNWFYDGVYYNYLQGIMSGISSDKFDPSANLSRAQVALMLYRLEGEPEFETDKIFLDVSGNKWYGKAVYWGAENGIISGYTDGTFKPNDEITREQMAAMLYRYTNYKEYDTSKKVNLDSYPDAASVSSYAKEAMQWAVGEGLITGNSTASGILLDPKGKTTRAQASVIFQRYTN